MDKTCDSCEGDEKYIHSFVFGIMTSDIYHNTTLPLFEQLK